MTDPLANPLVTALANGRPDAYAELYDRLGGPLRRVACRMLRSASDAEDAVQDLFVELARNRHRLLQICDLDAYLFTMLRHAVGRRIKSQQKEQRHLRQLQPGVATESSPTADHDLQYALQGLPTDQREVISLKIDGGLTFARIAEVLNISPNTAASRYRYALEKLRGFLESES
jgi:RNA polymerase sigma-70 factor (ECF subfamily)